MIYRLFKKLGEKVAKVIFSPFKEKEKDMEYRKITVNEYDCYIVNIHNMFLCGYIKIPKNNYYFGKNYDYLNFGKDEISIGCDWTYSGKNIPTCPNAGTGWFLGFDFAHDDDMINLGEKLMSYKTDKNAIEIFEKATRMLNLSNIMVQS